MTHFFHVGRPLRAYGSLSLSFGYLAISVSVSPNRMLIFDEALIAQPFALRSGAIFLRRSLSHAITIAGPEIASIIPINTRISFHPIPFIESTRPERAVPIIPKAIPIAANIPANLAISNGAAGACFAASPPAGGTNDAALIFSVASFIILASLSAAFLLMRFSMTVAILR